MSLFKKTSEAPLSAPQILYRLADIESNGINFYAGVLDGTHSDWVKKLADMLMRAEKRHRERFLRYAASAEKHAKEVPAEGPIPPELVHLLNAQVFAAKDRVESAVKYATDIQVINVAIRAEENVALLMTELCDYVPNAQKPYITRVVKEEWGHKAALEDLLRNHFGDEKIIRRHVKSSRDAEL